MRHTNLVFCLPVKEPCRPPPKPIGQDTRQCRFTTPLVGWSTPPMMLSKVDLPAPLRPTRPTFNLGGMVKFMRSEEHTYELQSLMRISYAVFCWIKKIYYISFSILLLTCYIT